MLGAGRIFELAVVTAELVGGGYYDNVEKLVLSRSSSEDSRLYLSCSDWYVINGDREALLEAHHTVIESGAKPDWITKSRKNQFWNWHRDDWRVRLAVITGEDIPALDYVPEDRYGFPMDVTNEAPDNAGQAIYDNLSNEAKAAVDALPKLDLDPSVLALFAEAITTAHESNANGWSLIADKFTGGKQFLRLTCNEIIALRLTKQQLQLAAKLTIDTTGTPETFGLEATVSPDTQYDEVIHYRILAAEAAKLPRDAVTANAKAIRWLGNKDWTNSAHH